MWYGIYDHYKERLFPQIYRNEEDAEADIRMYINNAYKPHDFYVVEIMPPFEEEEYEYECY